MLAIKQQYKAICILVFLLQWK